MYSFARALVTYEGAGTKFTAACLSSFRTRRSLSRLRWVLCIALFFRVRFYETAAITSRKKVGESEERSETFELY